MPFNPDDYLARKEASTANASSNAPAAFNPDAYLAGKGIQTLPNDGNIQDGASTADKMSQMAQQAGQTYQQFAPVAGQGAALGYGKQLNAGIQAGAGIVDQLINGQNNFGDVSPQDASLLQRGLDAVSNFGKNYDRAKQQVSDQIKQTRAASPVASALTEIAASIPPAMAGGAGLEALGASSPIAQAGIQGTAYGYGSSDEKGLTRLKEAASAGAISAATAGLFQLAGKGINEIKNIDATKYLESEYGDYSAPVKAISNMEGKATPEGGYELNFKDSKSNHFALGQEYRKALTDPNTQAQIAKELNSQPKMVASLIQSTKQKLGETWTPILNEHGAAPTDLTSVFKDSLDAVKDITSKGDPDREAVKQALLSQIHEVHDSLAAAASNDLSKVSLKDTASAQELLGKIIFKDKAFSKDSVVNGQAKRFFGKLAEAFNHADETVGSGGDLSNINKVYSSLYNMEDNMINGATIKSLTDPQAISARAKYEAFVEPFEKLSPEVRQTLAPEMHDYLANQFPKVFAKAKSMLVATERGAQGSNAGKTLLSLAGLRGLKDATISNVFNQAGVISQNPMVQGTAGSLGMIANGVQQAGPQALPKIAPALGGMAATGALRPMQ